MNKLNKSHIPFSTITEYVKATAPELLSGITYSISESPTSFQIDFENGVSLHVGLNIMECQQVSDEEGNVYNLSSVFTKAYISSTSLVNNALKSYAVVIKKCNILNDDITALVKKRSELGLYYSTADVKPKAIKLKAYLPGYFKNNSFL